MSSLRREKSADFGQKTAFVPIITHSLSLNWGILYNFKEAKKAEKPHEYWVFGGFKIFLLLS